MFLSVSNWRHEDSCSGKLLSLQSCLQPSGRSHLEKTAGGGVCDSCLGHREGTYNPCPKWARIYRLMLETNPRCCFHVKPVFTRASLARRKGMHAIAMQTCMLHMPCVVAVSCNCSAPVLLAQEHSCTRLGVCAPHGTAQHPYHWHAGHMAG